VSDDDKGKSMKTFQHKVLCLTTFLLLSVVAGCVPITAHPSTPGASLTPNAGEVEVNDIILAYESFGAIDDETILLIAGIGMQLVDWPLELVAELVQRGYRVVRFDHRDVGLSTKLTAAGLPDSAAIEQALQAGTKPPLPYTLQDMANDAVGLLDALQIQQAHLVGISMGGAIAQLVAIDHPERTRSLTLLMSDSGNPALPVVARPEAFAAVPPQPLSADRDAYIEWQVKTWQALAGSAYPTEEATLRAWAERDFARGYDPAGFARQGAAILVERFERTGHRRNNLETIAAPTVVLHGAEDPLVPVAAAEELAQRVLKAELRLIPGLGHDIPSELVPVFADAIAAAASQAAIQITPLAGRHTASALISGRSISTVDAQAKETL
jgi:pimeloyl-ACP methyl ester carboxylesterase